MTIQRIKGPLATLFVTLVSSFLLLALPVDVGAQTLSPDSTDARKIMEAVENRVEGDKVISRLKIVVEDSKGRKRIRGVQSRSLEFPGGSKQLIFFESPADVRNTGLLSIDYDDGAKTDDQWLYLPSLHKSTRINSSEKSGSFMGTDLSYSDMTQRAPSQYEYKMLNTSAQVDGEACWLIEARPTTPREKEETGYLKSQMWISKTKLLP